MAPAVGSLGMGLFTFPRYTCPPNALFYTPAYPFYIVIQYYWEYCITDVNKPIL